MSNPRLDLVGREFGRLVVVAAAGTNNVCHSVWLCKCVCGKHITTEGISLTRGRTKSCGCLRVDKARAKWQAPKRRKVHSSVSFAEQDDILG